VGDGLYSLNPKSLTLRDLVVKIARETGFGYTKILGELRGLGISRKICRQPSTASSRFGT
jgi:hypothetical protein